MATRVTPRAGSASLHWHESRHGQPSVIADVRHEIMNSEHTERESDTLPPDITKAREAFIKGEYFDADDVELQKVLQSLVKGGFPNERVRHFPMVMASAIHFIQIRNLITALNKENAKTQVMLLWLQVTAIVIAILQGVIAFS